jgi:hypothetical protein
MNEYVSQYLIATACLWLRSLAPQFVYTGTKNRTEFYNTSLDTKIEYEELTEDTSTYCIYQFSLIPKDEEPWPSEDPIRLPCGHVLGQICAKKWFNTLVDGRWQVPEDFNITCPYCRAEVIELPNIEEYHDENRSRWTLAAKTVQEFLDNVRDKSHQQAMGLIQTILDRLILTKWYVFRRVLPKNFTKDYDIKIVEQWWDLSRGSGPRKDWSAILAKRAPSRDADGESPKECFFKRALLLSRVKSPPAADNPNTR